jgi:hypothetical protein
MKALFLWCGALLTSLPRAVISVGLCVSGGVQAADEKAPAMNEIGEEKQHVYRSVLVLCIAG